MTGMCVTCGKPAMSPYVDGRFCHICGLAFGVGVQEGLRMAVNLIDPEPMSCDCRMPLRKDIGAHEYGCCCGGVTTLPREAPDRYPSHGYGCAWAEWARRELARRQHTPKP